MPSMKRYLGDSVYADFDIRGGIWLTTENGLPNDPSNQIFLESVTLDALLEYLDWLKQPPVSEIGQP